MKKEMLLWVGLSLGCVIGLWVAITSRQTQEIFFEQINLEKQSLQKKASTLKKDKVFMALHQKKIDYLIEKSWISPNNRLRVGDFLETLRSNVKTFSYRFEPEILKSITDNVALKVTNITFEMEAESDLNLYMLIENLLKEFPGIIIPRNLILTRNKDVPGVSGKFEVEWVAMRGDKNEE